MRTRSVVIALLAATFALTGCGSSTTNPASTAVTHAGDSNASSTQPGVAGAATPIAASIEAICTRTDRELAAIKLVVASQHAAKESAQKRGAIDQAALAKLSKLNVPSSMEPAWKRYLADGHTLVAAFHTISERGLTNLGEQSIQTATRSLHEMATAAKQNHLQACAQEN